MTTAVKLKIDRSRYPYTLRDPLQKDKPIVQVFDVSRIDTVAQVFVLAEEVIQLRTENDHQAKQLLGFDRKRVIAAIEGVLEISGGSPQHGELGLILEELKTTDPGNAPKAKAGAPIPIKEVQAEVLVAAPGQLWLSKRTPDPKRGLYEVTQVDPDGKVTFVWVNDGKWTNWAKDLKALQRGYTFHSLRGGIEE